MGQTKIEFKLGTIQFSAEGDQDWIEKQLDKLIAKAPELLDFELKNENSVVTNDLSNTPKEKPKGKSNTVKGLGAYLKEKNADKNQKMKFLATAIWLKLKHNTVYLSTGDVTSALRENQQTKLSNATAFLNENIKNGFCEKKGKEFFVTQDGFDEQK